MEPSKKNTETLSERKLSLRRYGKAEPVQLQPSKPKKEKVGPLNQITSASNSSDQTGRVRDGCEISPEDFQDIIQTRKSEVKRKAEEKRQEDLRRITPVNRNRGSGIHPLSLAPNEVWHKILGELEPEDRASMYRVHTMFQDLMENTLMTDTLFPLVMDFQIPLVRKYLVPSVGFPSQPDLSQLKILQSVSRGLRDSVDKWNEDRLIHHMQNFKESDDLSSVNFKMSRNDKIPCFPTAAAKRFFQRSFKVTIWFSELFDVNGNPPQLRSVLEIFSDFREHVNVFLNEVGNQILHFDFEIYGVNEFIRLGVPLSLEGIHCILREWLLLMPNLKWLVLSATDDMDALYTFPDQPNWMAMANAINVEMPTLSDLERVDLKGCGEQAIWNAVLIANPQIKYHLQERESSSPDIATYSDPAVLSLSLERAALGSRCNSHWNLPLLQKVSSKNNWNLKRLTLWINVKDDFIPMDGVLQCLQKFETLETLYLHINHVSIGDEVHFLRLPNLKEFSLEFGPVVKVSEEMAFFFSLQFLMHCGKLEKLTWENLMYDSLKIRRKMEAVGETEGDMMDFMGGNRDLCDSNIWDVFRKLHYVKVTFCEGAEPKCRKSYGRVYRERKLVKESRRNGGRGGASRLFYVGSEF